MCNDYAREIEIGRVIKLLKELENLPAADWPDGLIPNTSHASCEDKRPGACSPQGRGGGTAGDDDVGLEGAGREAGVQLQV